MKATRLGFPFALAVVGSACAVFCAPAFAAGFQLNESSASGLGNAFAGGAAAAQDASTVWTNPAGMARAQGNQLVGVIHLITPSIKFQNEFSAPATLQSLGSDGGDAGGLNVVPNLYLVMPLNPQWSIGVGINAPWGLVTEYDDGWIGRFLAIKSEVKTINVNAGASFKVSDELALGFGLDFQRLNATFTNQVNYSAALVSAGVPAASVPPGLESNVQIKGSDNGYGWNLGLLWDVTKDHRIGVHYRSSISYDVSGNVNFTNPAVPAALTNAATALNSNVLFNSDVTAKLKLPPIFNLSYFRTVNSRWDVMADAQWTGWSTIKDLTYVRANGTTLSSTPENFKNAWKFAIGADYRYDDKWMFRGGVAYDMSPVETVHRTPRLPDSDRTWLSAGAQFKWDPKLQIDFGAAYLWCKKAPINKSGDPPNTLANGLLNGSYSNRTSIVSAQLTYAF